MSPADNEVDRFRSLYIWDQDKVEDVRFWCEPKLTTEALQKIENLDKTLPDVKSVLIVDDILDTGRSLQAGQELLMKRKIKIVGAYYLLDTRKEDAPSFGFPIHSVFRHRLF